MNPHVGLPEVRRALAAISALGLLIAGVILRFDPPTAVWFAWGVLFVALFDVGLYLHDSLPGYQAGTWVFLGLIWFVGFLYSKQLSESLACPVVEYRGKLIASELPSPGNPCVKLGKEIGVQPPSEDAVFLFVGSNVAYSQKRGHWTVILDRGHVLLSADLDDKGLSVSTQLYDQQGTLQATVDKNEVDALSPDICVKRPDLSTLIVSDRSTNEERLYVRYLNPKAIELRGLFGYPSVPPVAITKEAMNVDGNTVTNSCMPQAMAATIFIR